MNEGDPEKRIDDLRNNGMTPAARPNFKLWIFAGVLLVIVCVAIPTVMWVALRANNHQHKDDRVKAAQERQFALPFTDLRLPHGVAVYPAGNVYVSDARANRVLKLAAGLSTQTVLPFTGLDLGAGVVNNSTGGVAVDAAGNVYVVDTGHDQVLELAAGSSTQSVLPFGGLTFPEGLAVDTGGTVYVADSNDYQVVKLAKGARNQSVLPSLGRGVTPSDVAVDTAGNVYVSVDSSCGRHTCSYLMKLEAGSGTWTRLESAGIQQYVAVDTAGNVYVITSGDAGGVMRLAPGSSDWTALPGRPLSSTRRVWPWTPAETFTSPITPGTGRRKGYSANGRSRMTTATVWCSSCPRADSGGFTLCTSAYLNRGASWLPSKGYPCSSRITAPCRTIWKPSTTNCKDRRRGLAPGSARPTSRHPCAAGQTHTRHDRNQCVTTHFLLPRERLLQIVARQGARRRLPTGVSRRLSPIWATTTRSCIRSKKVSTTPGSTDSM